jgi:osmotically-inducible protein OsmY
MQKLKMLAAAGVGFAAGYLFDPARGRSRRARLGDQAVSKLDKGMRRARSRVEYGKGMGQGLLYRLIRPFRRTRSVDDATLLQKVRSEAFGQWKRSAGVPSAVEIDIANGTILLDGNVAGKEDHDRLVSMVLAVDGVTLVEDRLTIA